MALDVISREELFNDLDFTIQILINSEAEKNGFETKFISQIEKFLQERINECMKSGKFGELPIPTIYRILDESKEKFDHNMLVDFIFESIETRFIMLKFVELDKLREDKVYEMIQLIDKLDETIKKIYLEYISFNLSFNKNMKIKYDQLFDEFNQTKKEFNQTKLDHLVLILCPSKIN